MYSITTSCFLTKIWNERKVFLPLWSIDFSHLTIEDITQDRVDLSEYYDKTDKMYHVERKEIWATFGPYKNRSVDPSKLAKLATSLDIDLALPFCHLRLPRTIKNEAAEERFKYNSVPMAYKELAADTFRRELVSGLREIESLKRIWINPFYDDQTIRGPFANDETLYAELKKLGYPDITCPDGF